IQGSTHVPPSHSEVKKHLLNFFKWYSTNKNKLHPFELAALVHAKLAWIHPFEDGNGRTARTVMNFILMKKRFPMFFIPFEKREEYYKSLDSADKRDYKEYIFRMLQLIIDQIRSYGHSKKE
ncbi:MAG: Fic family protein, partial [Nanoarchaeota archaeon]